jgi:hypothetical protein
MCCMQHAAWQPTWYLSISVSLSRLYSFRAMEMPERLSMAWNTRLLAPSYTRLRSSSWLTDQCSRCSSLGQCGVTAIRRLRGTVQAGSEHLSMLSALSCMAPRHALCCGLLCRVRSAECRVRSAECGVRSAVEEYWYLQQRGGVRAACGRQQAVSSGN